MELAPEILELAEQLSIPLEVFTPEWRPIDDAWLNKGFVFIGRGGFKDVYIHPSKPDFVFKVFQGGALAADVEWQEYLALKNAGYPVLSPIFSGPSALWIQPKVEMFPWSKASKPKFLNPYLDFLFHNLRVFNRSLKDFQDVCPDDIKWANIGWDGKRFLWIDFGGCSASFFVSYYQDLVDLADNLSPGLFHFLNDNEGLEIDELERQSRSFVWSLLSGKLL